MHIRDALSGEVDLLVRLWRRAVEATHDFLTTGEIDGFEVRLRTELPRAVVRVAVGPDDGPLGFRSGRGGDVAMLFVDPEVHGTGVGTALLDDVDAAILTVDVNEENPRAHAWYLRRGFVETARSDTDGDGGPHPLVHLRRVTPR